MSKKRDGDGMAIFMGFDGVASSADYSGFWRIYDGEKWSHVFRDKDEALSHCQKWNGQAIGLATNFGYVEVMTVED